MGTDTIYKVILQEQWVTNWHFLIITAFVTPTLQLPAEGDSDSLGDPIACIGPQLTWDYHLGIIRSRGTAQPLPHSFPQTAWGTLSLALSRRTHARRAGSLSKGKALPLSELRDELRPADAVRAQRAVLQARETDV